MRRYEENKKREFHLNRVFSYLRSCNQGDTIKVRDLKTDEIIEVIFMRRGRLNVSVVSIQTGKPELIPVERVVI